MILTILRVQFSNCALPLWWGCRHLSLGLSPHPEVKQCAHLVTRSCFHQSLVLAAATLLSVDLTVLEFFLHSLTCF